MQNCQMQQLSKNQLGVLGYNYDVGATKAQLARVLQQPEQIILVAKTKLDK